MGRPKSGGSGGIQENKRCSLIHGPRLLTVLLVISVIHVAASHNKMSNIGQGSNIMRTPKNVKTIARTNTQSSRVCNTSECIVASKEIEKLMNLTVDPCDDFYEYACGKWPIHNPLPPGFTYYSTYVSASFKTDEYKKRKLETATVKAKGASKEVQQMPSDLYKSCINVTVIDSLGAAPLKERITELGGWSMSGNWDEDKWNFNETLISMHKMKYAGGPVFIMGYLPGINKTNAIIQGGTTLNKVKYLNLSSKTMLAYRQLIIDVVDLLGGTDNTTAKKADEIIRFEAQLAGVSLSAAELDESLSTSKITLEQLQREITKFDWIDYFNTVFAPITIPKSEVIAVLAAPYLKKAMAIIQNTSKSVLANYMVWYKIQTELDWLSTPFRKAQFKYRQATTGTTSDKERWKQCVDSVFGSFDDVIAAAYVNDHHAQLARPIKMVKRMLSEVIQAFKENVNSLTWLDDATKIKVFEKVDCMGQNVGFPDYMLNSKKMATLFKKYSCLTIRKDTFFKNKVAFLKKKMQQILKDFRKPRDHTPWYISPMTGNAIYNTLRNKLTLPAAIFQPPFFFRSEFLRSHNLGNMGSIVGHEVMHGFSILGSGYDKEGKAKNWWSNTSRLEFNKRLKCYEKQYSAYKILGKYPMNVKDTADETIADNDSLKIALKAYYNWAQQNPSETWRLPGLNFTNEQLFFIGFAQNRCSSSTTESRIQRIESVRHPDDQFRVIGSLANSCDFAKAFKCKINSPMNPVNKCYLWSKEGSLV